MTSSGRRFLPLARYLLHGRAGDEEPERVAWTAGRHVGTDDPELAARLMQATANANARVQAPVYHLTIDPNPLPALERARARLAEQLGKAKARVDQLKEEITGAPSRDLLAQSIGHVVERLEPRELTQIRAYLTAPHRAIAFRAWGAVKDALLSRDRYEELER
jgi:hypothetical protein